MTLFAEDPKRSKEFYERAFDRDPVYEDDDAVTFRLDNALVNVLRRSEAPELVEPATVAAAGTAASPACLWSSGDGGLLPRRRCG